MKKGLSILLSVLMILSIVCMGASAESGLNTYEAQLIEKLSQGVVNAGGNTVYIPTSYVNQAENYFISSVDMTEEEYNAIVAILEEGIAEVKAQTGTNIAKYPYEVKADLLALGKKMVAVIGMTLTYDGQHVVIVDPNGKVAFSDEPVLKVTGGVAPSFLPAVLVVAGLAMVMTVGVVATKKVTAR